MIKYFTECYQSHDIDGNNENTCTPPFYTCDVCQRRICEWHANTFSHALTCRTPEETEKGMLKCGLLKEGEKLKRGHGDMW